MEYVDQPLKITNTLAILRFMKSIKPQAGWPAMGFEPGTSRMRVSSVTTEPPSSVNFRYYICNKIKYLAR